MNDSEQCSLDELLKDLEADPRYTQLASRIRSLFARKNRSDPLGLNVNSGCDGFAFTGRLMETGVMTAAFFHEINQPLQGIKGFAELIRDKCEEPSESKVIGWAQEIRRQVERVMQMQSRISSYLKPTDGDSTKASLRQCVDEAIALFEHRLVKKRVSIYLDIPPDMPELKIPSMHLVQILVNLVVNALDALESVKDPASRKLGIMVDQAHGHLIKIMFADTGHGVCADQLPNLFVPFNTTKGESGSGLGLIISQKLAQNAGGDLTISPGSDGVPGWKGAVFLLHLPTVDQIDQEHNKLNSLKEFSEKPITTKRLAQLELDVLRFSRQLEISQRVLLIDDNSRDQMDLIEALAQHSILADIVPSAEEALEKLSRKQYAVIISDLAPPGISGTQLLSQLHDISTTTEILVCTDSQSINTVIEALDKGASDYIPIPYPSRPFLSWKVTGALARFEFETRTNAVVRFVKNGCEKLALDQGKDVQAFCTIPLKRALDSYQNSLEETTIGVLGNKVLVRAAASLGYNTVPVKDESSAMDSIKKEKFQVLVLVEDRGLDAVDLIFQVRQQDPNMGLFIIAQENRLDDLVQAIGSGVGDYLLRPLEGRELFPSKLKKLISRRDRHLRYSRLLNELKSLNVDLQKVL